MSKTPLNRKVATSVYNDNGDTVVRYHATEIVRFNDNRIILKNDGYSTVTTKRRMNEVSQEYGLGFQVYQHKHEWFVDYRGETIEFENGMELKR